MSVYAGFKNEGDVTPDTLFLGGPVSHDKVSFEAGAVHKRAMVVGRVTATGRYKLSALAATDGSQNPKAIVIDDVDATGGVAEGLIYEEVRVNAQALILGAGHTVASVREALRPLGIHLIDTVA